MVPKKYHADLNEMFEESEYFITKTMSKRAAEELGRYTTKIDFRERLSALSNIRTLIIRGEEDTAVKLKDMELLNILIKDSKLIGIPDATHYVFVEKPDEFNRVIVDFFRE